jgi:excisionase family DNA binding protein
MEPLAYTMKEAVEVSRISRTKLYEAIGSGKLKVIKSGRRTLIRADELKSFLNRLTNTAAVSPV